VRRLAASSRRARARRAVLNTRSTSAAARRTAKALCVSWLAASPILSQSSARLIAFDARVAAQAAQASVAA
jgi:hypothetical protein